MPDNRTIKWGVIAIVFLILAWIFSKMLHLTVMRLLDRNSPLHIDRMRVKFLAQLARMGVYIFAFIFYAHLVPVLSGLGNAWLTTWPLVTEILGPVRSIV